MGARIGNASIIGLSALGFAIAMLGFWLLLGTEMTGALIFALLMAGIAETLAGLFEIVRGQTYIAAILTTFGLWIVGYYFLLTVGAGMHLVTNQGIGLFILLLNIPIGYFSVPALASKRLPLIAALGLIIVLLILVGLGTYFGIDVLNKIAIAFAFLSAIAVWFLAYEALQESVHAS